MPRPALPSAGSRSRLLPRLRSRAAALLLALLALAAPAAAQLTYTMVGNSAEIFDPDGEGGNFTRHYATSFTTGPSREGYTVTAITLYMRTSNLNHQPVFSPSTSANIILQLHKPGHRPGTIHKSFLTTGSLTTTFSRKVFTPFSDPAPILQPNTTYWVGIYSTSGLANPGSIEIAGTSSDDEDPGGIWGWSIGNDRLKRPRANSQWDSAPNTNALRMDVDGHPNDQTPPVVTSARVGENGTPV